MRKFTRHTWSSRCEKFQDRQNFYRPHPKDGEGNVFSLSTPGGYPYPIMLCNISQNAMGQTLGGVPCQVQPGRYPTRGYPARGTLPGGTLLGGYPVRYPLARSGWGVPCPGGTLPGGTLSGGTLPWSGTPPSQVRMGGTLPRSGRGGGTQVGQQKEYSIHGGRYASCVHAGGLSCCLCDSKDAMQLSPHNPTDHVRFIWMKTYEDSRCYPIACNWLDTNDTWVSCFSAQSNLRPFQLQVIFFDTKYEIPNGIFCMWITWSTLALIAIQNNTLIPKWKFLEMLHFLKSNPQNSCITSYSYQLSLFNLQIEIVSL